jgi:hypothetical protein
MNQRIARLIAGGATAAVLAGSVAATAFAQSAPTATPPAKPGIQQGADAFVNALASKLGKTPDEVRNAIKAARQELGTAGKAKGLAVKRVEAGKAVSDFLGLQPKELKAQLKQGKSLAQVATAQGKTVDQLKAFIRGQAKTKLDAAVAAGKLTQERENTALQRLDANLDKLVNGIPKVKAKP